MRQVIRDELARRVPALFHACSSVRNRRYFRRQYAGLHREVRRCLYPGGAPVVVRSGPFQGMSYLDEIVWGSITPRWLGSYEAELHGVIGGLAGKGYGTVIDVGCAEGYYAVGLARLLPQARVIAFDADFISRGQARRLAKLNGVEDRVEIRSFCRHGDLAPAHAGRTLVVCDIEGGEGDLLDPGKVASLCDSDILVEVHEEKGVDGKMEKLLMNRFLGTHRVQKFASCSREAWSQSHQTAWQGLSPTSVASAVAEDRCLGQVWLWMEAQKVPES
jgi:hypothetical protein